ncbi:SHOCT domain-containing protein [Parvibacter caecicola]|uniref:SHOCT domain-containing protein n=1 Tax=Parvibacter caecicola TaxID=747645 RepID=UPI00249C9420|nr:SHOCT domain-containing protein [Parvibacter caecicola]
MKIMGIGTLEFLIIVLVGCAFGVPTMNIAEKKGYNRIGFFAVGFLLGPIGLIVSLLLPDKNQAKASAAANNADALMKYKTLLDEGVITEAEYEAKRKELL